MRTLYDRAREAAPRGGGSRLGALTCAGPAAASPQQAGVQVALRALGLYLGPIDGDVGPADAPRRSGPRSSACSPAGDRRSTTRTRALARAARPAALRRRGRSRRATSASTSPCSSSCSPRDGVYRGALDGYLGPRDRGGGPPLPAPGELAADGVAGPRHARARSQPASRRRRREPRAAAGVRRAARRLADGDRRRVRLDPDPTLATRTSSTRRRCS